MQARLLLLSPAVMLMLVTNDCKAPSRGTAAIGEYTPSASLSDTSKEPSAHLSQKPEILSITLSVRNAVGKTGDVKIDLDKATGADAVFLSLDAVEKFALPFYLKMSPDSAAALQKRAHEEFKQFGIVLGVHKRLCYVLMPGPKWRGGLPFEL